MIYLIDWVFDVSHANDLQMIDIEEESSTLYYFTLSVL